MLLRYRRIRRTPLMAALILLIRYASDGYSHGFIDDTPPLRDAARFFFAKRVMLLAAIAIRQQA